MRTLYCSICSTGFDIETEGVEGNIGLIWVAFCSTCKTGIRDFAEQTWDLAPIGYVPEPEPKPKPKPIKPSIPYDLFMEPVCRGDVALGNNCGHCEKCEWIRENR